MVPNSTVMTVAAIFISPLLKMAAARKIQISSCNQAEVARLSMQSPLVLEHTQVSSLWYKMLNLFGEKKIRR